MLRQREFAMRFVGAWCALVLAAGVAPVRGATSGSLWVRVTDAAGTPLPRVSVTLTHERGDVAGGTRTTDADGDAWFAVLPAGGGYTAEISHPEHGTRRAASLAVPVGSTRVVTISFHAPSRRQDLHETGEPAAAGRTVDVDETASATRYSDELVHGLPISGRFYQNVLTRTPGVNAPNGDGNPVIHGSRSRDLQARVADLSQVDAFTGRVPALIRSEWIDEAALISAGAGVEYGRALGGFVDIAPTRGSNRFEGVLGFLYRTDVLDGSGANAHSARPPDFETRQPSVSVSGPIVRDRVWFRLNHELIDLDDPVATGSGLEITGIDRRVDADQITVQASPRHRLQFQFSSDLADIDNLGVSSRVTSESSFALERDVDTLQLGWTVPLSGRVLIDSFVATQRIDVDLQPHGGVDTLNDCLPEDAFLGDASCTVLQSSSLSGPASLSRTTRSDRLTVRSQATVQAGRPDGGSHRFRLGFLVENERYEQLDQLRPSLLLREDRVAATVAVPESVDLEADGDNVSFWFEDRYKPLRNLTLTLGARVDREQIRTTGPGPLDPGADFAAYESALDECLATGGASFGLCAVRARNDSFTGVPDIVDYLEGVAQALGLTLSPTDIGPEVAQQAFFTNLRAPEEIAIDNTNVSPFLAVKWDPFRRGRTAIGTSWRRYFDRTFLDVPLEESRPATTTLEFDIGNNFSGDGFVIPSPRLPLGGIQPTPTVNVLDRDLETPYQDEWVVTVEREIATETAVRFEYVRRKYRDQFQDVDRNRAAADFGRCKLATVTNNSVLIESPGTGTYIDPYTGEEVTDNDPGPGDGIVDDCAGQLVTDLGDGPPDDPFDPDTRLERPDGIPDLYVRNPAFGSIFFIGNLREWDYEAFVVSLDRRQYRGWELHASYIWSFATGNADEFQQPFGGDQSLTDDTFGFESTDQRHIVRVNGTTTLPQSFRLGAALRWESGLPFSVQEQRTVFTRSPPALAGFGGDDGVTRLRYPTGARNDERSPSFWNVDLQVSKDVNLTRGVNLQLSAEVFNVFNDDTRQVYNSLFELGSQVNGRNDGVQRFGRSWQLGLRLAF